MSEKITKTYGWGWLGLCLAPYEEKKSHTASYRNWYTYNKMVCSCQWGKFYFVSKNLLRTCSNQQGSAFFNVFDQNQQQNSTVMKYE